MKEMIILEKILKENFENYYNVQLDEVEKRIYFESEKTEYQLVYCYDEFNYFGCDYCQLMYRVHEDWYDLEEFYI